MHSRRTNKFVCNLQSTYRTEAEATSATDAGGICQMLARRTNKTNTEQNWPAAQIAGSIRQIYSRRTHTKKPNKSDLRLKMQGVSGRTASSSSATAIMRCKIWRRIYPTTAMSSELVTTGKPLYDVCHIWVCVYIYINTICITDSNALRTCHPWEALVWCLPHLGVWYIYINIIHIQT